MSFLNFQSYPIFVNLAIYAVAAAAVWFAGFRLAQYADEISDRTGLGKAFLGIVLLAVASSLPEIVTIATATLSGNVTLALNNVFGSTQVNMLVLAVTDVYLGRGAITAFIPSPVLLLQGALAAFILVFGVIAMIVGEVFPVGWVSLWTILFVIIYVVAVYLMYRYPKSGPTWEPADKGEEHASQQPEDGEHSGEEAETGAETAGKKHSERSLKRLLASTVGVSMVIMVAGAVLSKSADALAGQTGLGSAFVGATLLAIATSLPELSTAISAARLGNYSMAVSDVIGSNMFLLVLTFFADVLYREGPIIAEMNQIAGFGVTMGALMTITYLIGLIERRDRTFARAGYDSWAVIALYVFNVIGLYVLTSSR